MFRAIGPSGPESQAFPVRGSHFNRRLRALTAAGAGEIIPASFRLQEVGGGGGGGGGGGVLQQWRGYFCVWQAERQESVGNSREEWMARRRGGGGGCTCDNEGRQRTGQSASGEQLLRRQPSKK